MKLAINNCHTSKVNITQITTIYSKSNNCLKKQTHAQQCKPYFQRNTSIFHWWHHSHVYPKSLSNNYFPSCVIQNRLQAYTHTPRHTREHSNTEQGTRQAIQLSSCCYAGYHRALQNREPTKHPIINVLQVGWEPQSHKVVSIAALRPIHLFMSKQQGQTALTTDKRNEQTKTLSLEYCTHVWFIELNQLYGMSQGNFIPKCMATFK